MGVRGRVCEHCRLDELFLAWELRLFCLHTRALTAGTKVTAEEAARQAQVRVGGDSTPWYIVVLSYRIFLCFCWMRLRQCAGPH